MEKGSKSNMSTNEKRSKPLAIGITGWNFSKRITEKYSIFRRSGRLPDLICLRLSGIKVTKKINIISIKSTHKIFKPYTNLYLKLLLTSWNLNKTGFLQGAEQRVNLRLRLLNFLHNKWESNIMPIVPHGNIIAPPTFPDSINTKRKTPYQLNLDLKFYTFLRALLGDMEFINIFNSIGQAFQNQGRASLHTQMDRLEISSDQAQKHTPMIGPGEISLQLQTKGSRISQIPDKSFSASKSRQLPVNKQPPLNQQLPMGIVSMGGPFPPSFLREKDLQDRPVNTQQTWQFSYLNTDSQADVPHNKMRFFTLFRSPGETIMNPRLTKGENENAKSGFSGENAFSGMTLSPQKINNQALRSDKNIIPETVYPGPDNNIYNNIQIKKTSHEWQKMLLSSLEEPVSSITITPTNLILKKVLSQDADIFLRNKKEIEKTALARMYHINQNVISLIHKQPTMQNMDMTLENRKTLKTKETVSRKTVDENFITDTFKERPIQGITMIADRVYKIIEKRIAIERDRRGLS